MYLQQILFFNDPRTLLYRILHKHICFISTIRKIFDDCCDHCPEPSTPEEFSAQVEEDKIFIRDLVFDPIDKENDQDDIIDVNTETCDHLLTALDYATMLPYLGM
ncbi:hypothetical protein RhiirA5_454182 [Rhizophagus irregularis]|uniref:Uncharacterized protein n=1 Tax=Rhizophagus irregularis TaxID=588596 RepID=A0A2N0P688_9GLOM|nr:hypothetical protein RhiirA5_454182 [Rhizophagus irregularis]